jgi:threonine aldolase
VPTGTFGNQCSILTAGSPGSEIILGDKAHIISYENGSVGKISRMLTRTIQCDKSMFIPVNGLKSWIRKIKDSQSPQSTVFAI